MALSDQLEGDTDWYLEEPAAMGERLRAAAADLAAKDEIARLAHRQRDELVVAAIESKALSLRQVARAAGVSYGRIHQILAVH